MDVVSYLKIFVALLFMANPVAAIPTFLAATAGDGPVERNRTALTAAVTVGAVLVIFVFAGGGLLGIFGVSIHSFRVAGGIILMMLALAMLGGAPGRTKQRPEEAEDAVEKDNVGVVPIAIPLLAGPGAMSSMIVYSNQGTDLLHRGTLSAVAIGVALCVWICLRLADPLGRFMGPTGLNITTRVMGILIAAVSVEFITTGLVGLMPGLGVAGG
ncbi:MAG: MarC family protein [Myxococcota bacterium]|nr:MarC family protein [Myxococcota bacterium]